MAVNENSEKIKASRRNFIKILLIGGGFILLDRLVNSIFGFFSDSGATGGKTGNFGAVDNGKEVIYKDKTGKEVLIIEKGALE